MYRALVVAFFVFASTARAQDDSSGPMMEVNVFGVNSFGNVLALLPGGATGAATSVVSPSAAVGWGFGSNAILLNVSALGFGPGTNISIALSPLFRHYWMPLHAGAVSVFLEGGLTFAILSPASGNANYLIGIIGGAGAEWMFVEHLGLKIDALIEYGHAHFSGGGFGGFDTNVDVIGLAGNVGVIVHW